MNKKYFSFLLLLFLTTATWLSAQVLDPVKWTFSINPLKDNQYELIFKATIDDTWHLYSIKKASEDPNAMVPVPTSFHFDENKSVEFIGTVEERTKAKVEFDPNFELDLAFFEHEAIFVQLVKVKEPTKINGYLEFMCCDDKQCLAPKEIEYSFDFSFVGEREKLAKEKIAPTEVPKEKHLGFLLIAFLAGLAALLTPCVFPMIPMTVSFFLHSEADRKKGVINGLIFGISIILIYTVIGSAVAIIFGADFANWLSTHWLPNILFFLIFVVFAASFFGMFEITLPSWMITKSDRQAERGGLAGSFFMALTTVLVSFSCTGPIVGALLVESVEGNILKPILGMFSFGLAFSIPFTLFAIFPNWLANLPKSGGWLNSVKVILGFIELALGLKFLSVADQTYHWGILDREIYLAFWIVIFTLMGFYLLGKIKFAHDSDVPHLGVPRLILTIITFTFVIYLIPGMFGAPLKALSGYLPPQTTHDFDLNEIIRTNAELIINSGNDGQNVQAENTGDQPVLCETPKYADFLHFPHGLHGYFDYDQAMACAKAQNKPLFIDFTGHGCVNCREMEARVWSDPRVLKLLREEFVLVALYVDDKKQLPKEEWYTSKYDGKLKKTIGKKNADFQISKFGVNAQPYYVILNHDGKQLVPAHAYNYDIQAFIDFLNNGLEKFRASSVSKPEFQVVE